MELKEITLKRAKIKKEDGFWRVEGTGDPPPKWERVYNGRIQIPTNLSSFYVVCELARLFGEHSVTYFNYLPPKLREMLRTSTESVVHTMFKDSNNQQVELRIVEKPDYSMRASLMFTDYQSRKERVSIPLNDLNLYTIKEFIKPDIRRMTFVDNDGEFLFFEKEEDGSITFTNPYGEKLTLSPEQRCIVAASLNTLLSEQVRYWEFINNVRRDAIETALDDLATKREELADFLKKNVEKDKKCGKLFKIVEEESDWLARIKETASVQPRFVEPLLQFAVEKGISERAEKLMLALSAGREIWRKRVKAIRPVKLVVPGYTEEDFGISFWNDFHGEIPRPRMRFGRYYIKESVQNPIPILFLLSIFEPD